MRATSSTRDCCLTQGWGDESVRYWSMLVLMRVLLRVLFQVDRQVREMRRLAVEREREGKRCDPVMREGHLCSSIHKIIPSYVGVERHPLEVDHPALGVKMDKGVPCGVDEGRC